MKPENKIKALVIGPPGSGKTHFCGTFPKSYWISTEPDGYESVDINPALRKNTFKQDYYIPSPIEDVKVTFDRIQKDITEAYKLQAEGKIETLVLDNMTYLSENRWIYISKYEKEISKEGNLNQMVMFGKLNRWLYEFTLMNLCSFKGNVIVTSHIKQESDAAMEKKVGKDDIVADILGGFRNQAPGMFSMVMFLDKVKGTDGKWKYLARLNKSEDKLAKNRYNLPDIVENISYQTILDVIIKSKGL